MKINHNLDLNIKHNKFPPKETKPVELSDHNVIPPEVINKITLKALPLLALAAVAQWIECWPANQRVIWLILGQGTCLGCGPGPQ